MKIIKKQGAVLLQVSGGVQYYGEVGLVKKGNLNDGFQLNEDSVFGLLLADYAYGKPNKKDYFQIVDQLENAAHQGDALILDCQFSTKYPNEMQYQVWVVK